MSAVPAYPVRIEGTLERQLSRWLWLVKWLLVIPHVIVLVFLWIAFFVLERRRVLRDPVHGPVPAVDLRLQRRRPALDVARRLLHLRRARDRPLSAVHAARDPDYPATLEVEYPERLSRGLVLVKWWLLAIPHYLIVGCFAGGGSWLAWKGEHGWTWGGGLIGLLVLIAGVALLFTGRYPRGIFDLVLGLDRWVLRVAAYAALMTDAYPPFRLDQGGSDPGAHAGGEEAAGAVPRHRPPAGAAGAAGASRCSRSVPSRARGARVLAAGAGALAIDRTQRQDGFVTTVPRVLDPDLRARLRDGRAPGPRWAWRDLVGTVRVTAKADHPVFLGIARRATSSGISAGSHEVVRDIGDDPGEYERSRAAARHSARGAGVLGSVGAGHRPGSPRLGRRERALGARRDEPGRGALRRRDTRIGAELDALAWVAGGLLGAGVLLAVLAGALIYLSLPKTPCEHGAGSP